MSINESLIHLAYLKPDLRQGILGRTASSVVVPQADMQARVDRVKYDLRFIKEYLFKRIQSAVETSTRESWLEVWDSNTRPDVGADEDGNVYANIRIAITSFARTPKLDVVERAVLRTIKKIPGGYVGSLYPKDDPDHGIVLKVDDEVYLTVKVTEVVSGQ